MKNNIRQLISEEVRTVLSEDYARGIPDFVLRQVAEETTEKLKRHISIHVSQTASDPSKQRQMIAAANEVLEELELEIKAMLEDKLLQFMRRV